MGIPVCAIGKLLLRLGPSLLGLTRARKQAVRGFREGLADCGLPPAAIEELAEAYPSLDLRAALTGSRHPD